MYRYLSITTILLFCSSLCFSQQGFKLYTSKGQWIADSTQHISKIQLKRFRRIEDTLVQQVIKNMRYPRIEYEAGVQGVVYTLFTINNSDSLGNIRVLRGVSGGPDLDREVIRILKRIRIPKGVNKKPIKDSVCNLAIRFETDDRYEQITAVGREIIIPSPKNEPLDYRIKKWMDSITAVLNGRWAELDDFKNAIGKWGWGYIHNNRNSQVGNPNTDTFYVSREIYGPNECPHPSDTKVECIVGFQYNPGKRMISDNHEVIYLLDSGPLYYSVNSYGGGWGVGGGTDGAYLYTGKKTYYSGNENAFVKSPDDTSKYYVFINNLNKSHNIRLSSFVIGGTKRVFKKDTIHRDGGILITCKSIVIRNSKWTTDIYTDSINYLLFSPDSVLAFHKGDTVLLRTETNFLVTQPNSKLLKYLTVYQLYPFNERQIEAMVDFHTYSGENNVKEVREIRVNSSLFSRIFHKNRYRDPKELDPVFQYLKKNKLFYTN